MNRTKVGAERLYRNFVSTTYDWRDEGGIDYYTIRIQDSAYIRNTNMNGNHIRSDMLAASSCETAAALFSDTFASRTHLIALHRHWAVPGAQITIIIFVDLYIINYETRKNMCFVHRRSRFIVHNLTYGTFTLAWYAFRRQFIHIPLLFRSSIQRRARCGITLHSFFLRLSILKYAYVCDIKNWCQQGAHATFE